ILALKYGFLTFTRSEALRFSKPHLSRKELALVEKLEAMEQKQFRTNDPGIIEETKDFLLTFLNFFCEVIQTHKSAKPLKVIPQRIDCLKEECFQSAEERVHIERLLDYLQEKWQHTCRGVCLVPCAYFDLDEMELMIEVDLERFPTHQELTTLYLLHSDVQ